MGAAARRIVAVGLIGGIAAVASGQDAPAIARYVPSVPDPAHVFVLDSAHLLMPSTIRALQDSARALQTETAADVAWITLPSLGGRPIEEAALYIGRTWRIGSAGKPGDPLRNRGLVILFIPDKTKTAGSNFRIEVGNGLEGTITDSRSRTISQAMREYLRAKRYDEAYMAGWGTAAALVREDFASHGEAGVAAAAVAAGRTGHGVAPVPHELTRSAFVVVPMVFLAIFLGLLILLIAARARRPSRPVMVFPVGNDDDDDPRRRTSWFSSSGGSDYSGSSGSDSSSSSSDGGSFGDGGGFSGGGSSDTI